MAIDLQKVLNGLLVLLTICLGALLGGLAADWAGVRLAPPETTSGAMAVEPLRSKEYRLQDFSRIAQRHLFDSNAAPASLEEQGPVAAPAEEAPPARRVDLKLYGTVSGGDRPLAVISSGAQAEVYRLGDSLPGNLTLAGVERDRALVRSATGEETVLLLEIDKTPERPTARTQGRRATADASSIVEIGDNSWQIPREEADRARANLNALLKTARMVPKIEQGETVGFTIVSINPGTFLDLLGLQVGDVLVQINDVELNSPEKALQIFQQVREANQISLGLLRNGNRETFDYTID